jgi:PAS domain S-box-containing protein
VLLLAHPTSPLDFRFTIPAGQVDSFMSSVMQSQDRPVPSAARQYTELFPDLYRQIFLHSSEPIAIISPEGYYIQQNAAHRNLMGYSDTELENQTPAIHLGAETFAAIAKELAEKGEYKGEVISQTKSGEKKYVELSAFSMLDDRGHPLCYVGIKRDITQRRRAEEALRQSETELADSFENAAIGLHWANAEGTIIRVNQTELDLLGYSREEYIGHNVAEFYADPPVIQEMLRRLTAGEVLRDYEARLRSRDSSIIEVQINSSGLWQNGEFIHTRCFTRDVTELKRTERRLSLQYAVTKILSESRDFFEGAHKVLKAVCESLGWELGALWKVDTESQALRCVDVWHVHSARAKRFEKLSRGSAFTKGIGLPGRIWARNEPAWIPNVLEDSNFPRGFIAADEGLLSAFGFPIRIGAEVLGVVEFFSREMREPDAELLTLVGAIGGQIGQFKKRKRAEVEYADLLERERAIRADAEQANRLKDEFLATLSHELRTPLNAVIGWSRMLRSGKLDKESSNHALGVIERNAWAQKQIIEDILDVSRVITGKLQLKMGPVDLVTVVDGALDAMRPALEAKDIEIETIIDARLKMVSGDPDRLQQVVWNLLSNATKFTPAGGKVEIRVTCTEKNVQIEVSDTGPGIDAAFRPYMFERFRQGDGSITRTHGGLGLGLAIVRHLVELHGGTIFAENRQDGPGAAFTVKLPMPTGELQPEVLASAAVAFRESEPELPSLEDLRILVVDDETDALDLISMELTQRGARVTSVTNVKEALATLENSEFDLLISDVGMPEIDGYDFMRQVRRSEVGKQKRIPAVALTAYARVQDRMRAILAGYNTHVPKPVEANELVTVVAGLAGRLGKN